MWKRFLSLHNYVRMFGKSLLEVQKIKLDESWSVFWVKTAHGFLSSGKSASLQWLSGSQLECLETLPCLATVFQVCVGSVAVCCSVSGPALFDHPSRGNWIVPQCQDATESNQPLFFPKPNSCTLVLQIKDDSGPDRALIDLPLPCVLRAKWPSTRKSAEIWSFG